MATHIRRIRSPACIKAIRHRIFEISLTSDMASVAKLLMIQGGKCFYCGNKLVLEDATVDHVMPKALGGDNTEANTVACCHSINQAFGNATPKEKLTAIINAGGRIECPPKPVKKATAAVIESPSPTPDQTQKLKPQPAPSPVPKPATGPNAAARKQAQIKQKPAPERRPSELRKQLQEAFQAAAAVNGGNKAMLTAVSLELRKRVQGFVVKSYGEKTFAKLVSVLGYRIDKNWCLPPKQ